MAFLSGRTSLTTVGTADIVADAVTNAKLADDAINGENLNVSLVQGDLVVATGTDTLSRLAKGTADQVLTMNDGATAAGWETAGAGGGLIFIASADASNAASADFDGVFTTTYKRYLLLGTSVNPHGGAWIAIRTDSNAGASYDAGSSDYSWTADGQGHGGQVTRDLDFSDSYIVLGGDTAGTHATTSDIYSNGFELWIDDPMDSGGRVTMRWNHCSNGAGEFGIIHGAGARLDTAAQDSIQVLATTGNISGHFVLYGVVDS